MFQALKGILKNVGTVLNSDTNNGSEIKPDFKTKHNDVDKLSLGLGTGPSLSSASSLTEPNRLTKNAEMVQNSNNIEEPVILTLSSDEDDDDDGKLNGSFQKSFLSNSGEEATALNSGSYQLLNLHNKEPIITQDFNNDIYERRHAKHPGTYLEKKNHTGSSNYKTHSLNIPCRSIRIGSYQVTPIDKIAINAAGIQMKVQPFARGEKEPILVSIKIKKILKILASFESSRHNDQVIFLYLTPCIAEDIRSKLKMFDKKFFYFDPCSSEQSHRRITLFPDKMKADSVFLMKNILNFELLDMTRRCKVYDLLEDLSYKEANDILTKSSTCEGDVAQSLPLETIKLFIYPPPPSKGGITITTADYQCLAEDTFLNDVLIDFHLKWLALKKLSAEDNKRTHIMSSFFYKRLTAKPKKGQRPYHPVEDASNITAARKRHDRVKSWTKSVDIFDKDFILIPINERSHWFLVVICFPGLSGPTKIADGQPIPANVATEPTRRSSRSRKSCEMIPVDDDDDEFSDRDEAEGDAEELDDYFDDSEEPATKKQKLSVEQHAIKQPCILIFDSLSTRSRYKIVATLREYLAVEYFTKKMEAKEFNKMTMPGSCPKVPQQRNFSDCGIFVMQYAESFFDNPITDFTLPICSLTNWFGQDVMHKKRESIANLLKELLSLYNPSRLCSLPPITFPSLKEEYADTNESKLVDQGNQAEVDADSTTFSSVDSFPPSSQEIPMRKKININISRRSSNIECTNESDNKSLLNNLISVSNNSLPSPMACSAEVSCSNNTANKCHSMASACVASSLTSQQSSLQITSDNPSINSVKTFPKFGKPDYITHFEKLKTSKTTGLQQIISNYDGSDGDSDDEIFVSKKGKPFTYIENKFTESSVEAANAVQSLGCNSDSTVEIMEVEELTNVESDCESEDVYANLSINNFEDSPRTDNLHDLKSP